ncbi:MAG: GAF domain-containing protein [Thermomicrobiales bacterium]
MFTGLDDLIDLALAPEDVATQIAALAAERFAAVAIVWLPEALGAPVVAAGNGAIRNRWERLLAHEATLIHRLLQRGDPVLIADALNDSAMGRAQAALLGLRSWISIPLQAGKQTATLALARGVDGPTDRPLDGAALRAAQRFARQAGLLLDHALLRTMTTREGALTGLLREIGPLLGRSVASSGEIDRLLGQLAQQIGRCCGDSCSLFRCEPGEEALHLVATYHPDPAEQHRRRAALLAAPPYWGEGAIGLVAAGGPPHLIRDLRTDITGSLHSVDMHGLRSWLCLPLRDDEQTYGVLTLGRTAARVAFDEDDLETLGAVAQQLTQLLRQGVQLNRQQILGELRRAVLALANEAARAVAPADIPDRLANVIQSAFPGAEVAIYVNTPGQRQTVLQGLAPRDFSRASHWQAQIPFGRNVVGWVAERGEPMRVAGQAAADLDAHSGHPLAHGDGAWLALPLPGRAEPLGVVALYHAGQHTFAAEDLALVRDLAFDVVLVLEHAILQERLGEATAMVREFVDQAPEPAFVLNLGGRFLSANEAMCSLTGRSLATLQEQHLTDLLAADGRESALALLAQVIVGNQDNAPTEWVIMRPDHTQRMIEPRLRVLSEQGQPVGVQVVARDVTSRYEQQRALARQVTELTTLHLAGLALANSLESETIQQTLLGGIRTAIPCDDVALYVLDSDGALRLEGSLPPSGAYPPTFARDHEAIDWSFQYGQSLLLNDLPGDLRFSPLSPLPPTRHLVIVPLLTEGEPRGSLVLRRSVGESFTLDDLRLVESIAAPAAVTLHNARLRAETSGATADLRAVLESIQQGIVMADGTGRVRFANRRLGELLALDVRQLIGRRTLEAEQQYIAPLTRDGRVFTERVTWLDEHPEELSTIEVTLTRPVVRILERYGGPLRDPHTGAAIGRIVVYTDVTEARQLEHAKDEFLATASHELKTPLTTLNGYLELLERQIDRPRGPDLPKVSRYVATARGELQRLRRLSEDLLEVARIEAGRLRLQLEPGDLTATVRDTVERFVRRPGLAQRGHQIVCQTTEALLARHDPLRIGQVINNLLENALKYSPTGGEVRIAVGHVGSEALISVQDAGIGIPATERERLFSPFYRATNASAGSPEGLGLGLYISRGIVEGHGGRIWAEPGPGVGTIFRVALPLDSNGEVEASANAPGRGQAVATGAE